MRHLIVEGPDGSGKTRLIEALVDRFPQLIRAEKASRSLTGPVPNLAAWVRNQYHVMDMSLAPLVYDRHPVISEPIYGPLARGFTQPGFTPCTWLSTAQLHLYSRTIVIWCIPPLEQVQKAITDGRDMPGVAENIEAIHAAYVTEADTWSGIGIRYDLTAMPSRDILPDGLFSGAVEFVSQYSTFLETECFSG